jgi:hypothetical protein
MSQPKTAAKTDATATSAKTETDPTVQQRADEIAAAWRAHGLYVQELSDDDKDALARPDRPARAAQAPAAVKTNG